MFETVTDNVQIVRMGESICQNTGLLCVQWLVPIKNNQREGQPMNKQDSHPTDRSLKTSNQHQPLMANDYYPYVQHILTLNQRPNCTTLK